MFASQRVRLAAIAVAAGLAVGASLVADRSEHSRAGAAGRRDRAAVEAAARRLSYAQVADAWTRTKLGDTAPLGAVQASVGVRLRTVHDEGDAIIVTFVSGYGSRDVCLDLVARPESNTVRSRGC